ncbi:MAG: hypothetical protein ACE5E5_01875 [Phycisphaerae bacterium]
MTGLRHIEHSGHRASGTWSGILLTSAIVVLAARRFGCGVAGWANVYAFALAFLSLGWSVVAAIASYRVGRGAAGSALVRPAHWSALVSAVPPVVLAAFLLAWRSVYVGTAFVFGDEFFRSRVVALDSSGLWYLWTVGLSCVVSFVATRDRRLFTCLMWIVLAMVLWTILRRPVFEPSAVGELRRTGLLVWMTVGGAVTVWLAVVVARWRNRRLRWQWANSDPDRLIDHRWDWPGLASSVAALNLGLILVSCFLLVVPVSVPGGGFSFVLIGAADVLAAAAGFLLLVDRWNRLLAESAMGLVSLAIAALAATTIPSFSTDLSVRYPSLFCALMIGFSLAAALWCWLQGVWAQQLNGGKAWTVAGRMIPLARRFAFFNIALALALGSLLAVWPRLRGVATSDDTLRSMVLGLGANFSLLLIALWVARKTPGATFYLLAILAVFSCLGFVLIRALPFSPGFG